MKSIQVQILSVFFIAIFFCVINLLRLEQQRHEVKADLVELSKIKYGVLNVDEWKLIITHIITDRINEMDFEPKQKEELRLRISTFLNNTIDQFRARFFEEKEKSIVGLLQSGITSMTGMFDKIKKDVPFFTDEIMRFIESEENREKAKEMVLEKFTEYTDKTFSQLDYTKHNEILTHYGYGDRKSTIAGLQQEVRKLNHKSVLFLVIALGLNLLCCIWLATIRRLSPLGLYLLVGISLCFLWAGLFLPMIEIDARVQSVSFRLLGDNVTFADQVLYYRSKSILQVVRLLLFQGKWDIALVGALVLIFSVLFPLAKLLSTVMYMAKPSLQSKKFIQFMVFKIGKWSMADVMVVAIFMAYLGFSGILTEQLHQIEHLSKSLDVLTTNKSSLQYGFPLFTSFVLLSLMVTYRLQHNEKITNRPKRKGKVETAEDED